MKTVKMWKIETNQTKHILHSIKPTKNVWLPKTPKNWLALHDNFSN